MPKIIGILTRHYSKRDSNGNVYDFASYTDTETGKTVEFTSDNIEHIGHRLQEIHWNESEVFYQEIQHGQRELFKMSAKLPYAGCKPLVCARWIVDQLNK
jgi:hypothetical protein